MMLSYVSYKRDLVQFMENGHIQRMGWATTVPSGDLVKGGKWRESDAWLGRAARDLRGGGEDGGGEVTSDEYREVWGKGGGEGR